MIVILQKDLKGTGKAGDVVKVSDGYARNMLIPRGIAKEATEGNIKNLKKQQEIAAVNYYTYHIRHKLLQSLFPSPLRTAALPVLGLLHWQIYLSIAPYKV